MMKTPTRTVVKAALKGRPKRPLSTRAMTGASVALFALTFAPLLAPPKPYELNELRSLLSGESVALTYAPSGPVDLTEDSERPVAERRHNAVKAEVEARENARPAEAMMRESDEPAEATNVALAEAPALAGSEQTTEHQTEQAQPAETRQAQARVEREPAPIEVEAEPLEELEPVLPEQTDADNED